MTFVNLVESPYGRPSVGVTADTTVIEAAGPVATSGTAHSLRQVSETFPGPTLLDGFPVRPWLPSSVTRADIGRLHVFIDGADRSTFRGVDTIVDDYQLMDPFGCGPAHFRFPAITGWDHVGTGSAGDTSWVRFSSSVDLYLVDTGGTRQYPPLWSGEVTKLSVGSNGLTMECVGDCFGPASLAIHKPAQYVPLTDRGTLIVKALNGEVLTRRVASMAYVSTGHSTAGRGSSDQSVAEYVQSTLPLGWTVRRKRAYKRSYELAQRTSGTRPTWTFRHGQRGFDVDLAADIAQAPNAIYGRGVQANGYAWANWKFPGQLATQPAYPNTSPSNTIAPGEHNSDTDSGTGVTDIQQRINDLNITGNVTVNGFYDSATTDAIEDIQRHAGITVDGIVGGQTWNALWPLFTGVNIGAEIRLTIAGDDRIVPRIYGADGSDMGPNPEYNPGYLRIEKEENFGSGLSKYESITSASAEFQRTVESGTGNPMPGWLGTVTARVDFNEGSRWQVREGDRIKVKDFQGSDPLLHVAQVQARPSDSAGSVTFTVDQLERDLPTIAAIRRQDEDSKDDPLRLPGRRARRTATNPDAVEPFDGESSAGRIPKIPLFASLWTVQAIPLSAAGKISRIRLQTTSPACAFAVALFGDAVTADQLARYVGNPVVVASGGRGPYQPNQATLATLGFIDAVGGPNQAAGYSPGQQTSPWDGTTGTVTGLLDSQAPISYKSARPPWIWVGFYAASSCYVSGQILPGPIEG